MAGESLPRVERRFALEQSRLCGLVVRADAESDEPRRRALIEYSLVALQDAWSRFGRDVILASAVGGAVTATGATLSRPRPGIRNRPAALAQVRAHMGQSNKPWWEPAWFDPVAAGTAATALSIPNSVTVTSAFGASTNPIEDLRWVRNFAVHRGPATAVRCVAVGAKYGVADPGSPTQIALHVLPTAPGVNRRLFEIWCSRLRSVARNAVS